MVTATAKDTREYISDYVKFGDAKAGGIVALASATVSALGVLWDKLIPSGPLPGPAIAFLIAIVSFVLIPTLLTIWHAVGALNPRVQAVGMSLVSFPDIARYEPDEFRQACANLAESTEQDEYAKHCVTLARIANAKYESIREAVWWLRLLLIGAVALIFSMLIASLLLGV